MIATLVILFVLVVITAFPAGFFTSPPLTLSYLTGSTMGTTYAIKYRHVSAHPSANLSAGEIQQEIEWQLAAVNQTMSTYDPESELSRFNRSESTDWIPVSAPLYTVLKAALEIGSQSKGAFDITVGPLVNLWGFGPQDGAQRIPDAAEIAATLERTGFDKLMLHDTASAVRKTRADVYVDLSGIAKGYAVDQIAAMLERYGVAHYMVEIGGEIRARGSNAQQIAWQIGIDKPQMHGRAVQKVLSLKNTALATSGNYRNYFMIDNRRYMHVIDPVTGWPANNNLVSVTVLAETGMLADAWATALLVLGFERGMAMAERIGLRALFIADRDGIFTEHATGHFESDDAQSFAVTFLAAFLVMGIAIAAMAIGVMMGRKPIAGSCGGLGRVGLECDGGCGKPCSAGTDCKPAVDKPES